jgi:trehalose 6-phosphate synthase
MCALVSDRLILVSNRGPATFERRRKERLLRRGDGGLVSALSGLIEHRPALWVAAAMTNEDRTVAEEAQGGSFALPGVGVDTRGRFVVLDDQTYHGYYNVIANPILWFIQHYLWDLSNAPNIRREELDAWEHGYVAANHGFAEAVLAELSATPDATVMLHDYHLYLAPEVIRAAAPRAFLHFFVHIPWPQPDLWRVLPPHIREALLRGLLANDIVAFHTRRYARNFLLSCEELLDIPVDYRRRTIRWDGREVWVRSYPISINTPQFTGLADGADVATQEESLLRRRRKHLICRIDRTDLAKNILRGFIAFDRFLELHPEFAEEITFVAMLQPSRQDVPEYVEYVDKVSSLVSHINTKHGNTDWMPIDLRFESNLPRAIALYKHYDVLMVNSIFDGMNLVAKEGPIVNTRNGVVILSENAGAHEEIGSFALAVNPFDIEAQADALFEALTMSADERSNRAYQMRLVVNENDVTKWLAAQQADITRKKDRQSRAGSRR